MSAILSQLAPPEGARSHERRVGRGPGGGKGKTSGKGMKGQKARHPGNFGKLNFQGGQTPIQRRLPKRGFRVPFPVTTVTVNVGQLERLPAGTEVTEEALRAARLVQGRGVRIKILGEGDLSKKLVVSAHGFSKSAIVKIEQAGGKIVQLPFGREPAAASEAAS